MRRNGSSTGWSLACALSLALSVACGSDDEPEPPAATPASPKALVKLKNGVKLQMELERALAIDADELCQELGRFECFGLHRVVLGSADAFGVGLYEPLPTTTSTTPLAVERVVLSACSKRAAADLADPAGAVIYAVEVADGALASVDAAGVGDAIDRMYQRALSRRATAAEIEHHRQLYRDVEASGRSQAPARDWAALSCFAVFTSLEALFY